MGPEIVDVISEKIKTNSVGFPYLLAQSIALITPMGAAFVVLLGTASFAEGAFPLADRLSNHLIQNIEK